MLFRDSIHCECLSTLCNREAYAAYKTVPENCFVSAIRRLLEGLKRNVPIDGAIRINKDGIFRCFVCPDSFSSRLSRKVLPGDDLLAILRKVLPGDDLLAILRKVLPGDDLLAILSLAAGTNRVFLGYHFRRTV
jgi:hypothetical protein